MKQKAVYRNGLYFVTSSVRSGDATLSFLDSFACYDGIFEGDIQISEPATQATATNSADSDSDVTEEAKNAILAEHPQFTWISDGVESEMRSNGEKVQAGPDENLYARAINEIIPDRSKDTRI